MPQLIGKFGTYPPNKGWDMVKLKKLAFTGVEDLADDESEYLGMWLQTAGRAQVMDRLTEWEAEDRNRLDNIEAAEQRQRDRPVGRALIYTEDDLKNGRIDPEDLAR